MAGRLVPTLTLATVVLAASACECSSLTLKGSRRTEIDVLEREAARKEVYATVLDEVYRTPDARQYVVDPVREASTWAVGQDWCERVPGLRRDTASDFQRATAAGVMPRDLVAGLPLEWFGADECSASVPDGVSLASPAGDRRWEAFQRRFPGASRWLAFSEVGFAADGREALVHVRARRGSFDATGALVLLRRTDGVWHVHRTVDTSRS